VEVYVLFYRNLQKANSDLQTILRKQRQGAGLDKVITLDKLELQIYDND
jgi:hypothetical protein